jgi:histidinol dehydrogenase
MQQTVLSFGGKFYDEPSQHLWQEILQRPVVEQQSLHDTVNAIMLDVKNNGDEAVKKYTLRFDGISPGLLLVTDDEFAEANDLLDDQLKDAIRSAKQNIETFHAAQIETHPKIETVPGVFCWRKSVAIQKVGLYIPGGTAPLFSTVIMLGVPAIIAGCADIILCTPPANNGKVHPAILFAASVAGINKVYKVGGVQAIAAMAYGTASIEKVYKIFGPGNQYVTAAKAIVNAQGTAIDMPAGPSEVAVFADDNCVPAFVAADLLSQAEHGLDSQVLLVATSDDVIQNVAKEIEIQLQTLQRNNFIKQSLQHSIFIKVSSTKTAFDLLNEYAPEHLIIAGSDALGLAEKVTNAGSVFIGNYSSESAGDYASGTNHTLPTNGFARAYSGVSVDSFVKKITFQEVKKEGIKSIADTVETMAEAEGLHAHKQAMVLRRRSL